MPLSAKTAGRNRADKQERPAAEPFARTELFFGTARPDGPAVSEAEWRRFLDKEITPRFPDGLTVLTGIGQFRAEGMLVQERSMLLILLYPLHAWKSSDEKIEQLREAYKQAFRQQSVLRVDDRLPVWVSF